MATVRDLYEELGKAPGLAMGEMRHLARAMQDAGLLPKAGRRQLRAPPEIATKDAAIFLIGFAAARTSGSRTPLALAKRVRAVQRLVTRAPDAERERFDAELTRLIDLYRDTAWVTDKDRLWDLDRIVIMADERWPQAWVEWAERGSADPNVRRFDFISKKELDLPPDRDEDGTFEFYRDAFMIGPGVFYRLRQLLGPLEAEAGEGGT